MLDVISLINKQDNSYFVLCLQEAESNTLRLREHDQVVMVFEKIPLKTHAQDGTTHAQYK